MNIEDPTHSAKTPLFVEIPFDSNPVPTRSTPLRFGISMRWRPIDFRAFKKIGDSETNGTIGMVSEAFVTLLDS
jgi:hypothetical protein